MSGNLEKLINLSMKQFQIFFLKHWLISFLIFIEVLPHIEHFPVELGFQVQNINNLKNLSPRKFQLLIISAGI